MRWPVLCPPRNFYSEGQENCLPCSSCPLNYIVLTPCQGTHDTTCEPYYDLQGVLDNNHRHVVSSGVHGDEDVSLGNHGVHADASLGNVNAATVNTTGSSILSSYSDKVLSGLESILSSTNKDNDVIKGGVNWKSVTIFACVSVLVAMVVLVIGVFCIKRRLALVHKASDVTLAVRPNRTGGEYKVAYTPAPPEPLSEDV